MAFMKKSLLRSDIPHSCDYCQNCIVEAGKNFCKYKRSMNKKGKCSKFDYNPVMRKLSPIKVIERFSKDKFDI